MVDKGHALARHEILEALADLLTAFLGLECEDGTVPSGETYYVSSGDVWAVLALAVEGELRIDGEVHCWGDVTGGGTITGEGELRLH